MPIIYHNMLSICNINLLHRAINYSLSGVYVDIHVIITNLFTYISMIKYTMYLIQFVLIIIYHHTNIHNLAILTYYNRNITTLTNIATYTNLLNSNYTLYIIFFLNTLYAYNLFYIWLILVLYYTDISLLSYTSINNIYINLNHNILLDSIYLYIHPILLVITATTIIYFSISYLYYLYYIIYQYKYYKINFFLVIYMLLILATSTLIFGSFWAFLENTWGGFWVWDYSECLNFNIVLLLLLTLHLFNYIRLQYFYYTYIHIFMYFTYIYVYVKIYMLNTSHMFNNTLYWYEHLNWSILLIIAYIIYYYWKTILAVYKYNTINLINFWFIYYFLYFLNSSILNTAIMFNLYNYILMLMYVYKFTVHIYFFIVAYYFTFIWNLFYYIFTSKNKSAQIYIHIFILNLLYMSYLSKYLFIEYHCIKNLYEFICGVNLYICNFVNNLNNIFLIKNINTNYINNINFSLYPDSIAGSWATTWSSAVKLNIIDLNYINIKINKCLYSNWVYPLIVSYDWMYQLLYSYLLLMISYMFYIK